MTLRTFTRREIAAALDVLARPFAALQPGVPNFDKALGCSVTIAGLLGGGLVSGHATVGAIACGGAFTVGSGAYQSFAHAHRGPMLAATIGIGLSTAVGTLAGVSPPALAAALLLWGLAAGLAAAAGPAAQWIGQQCVIYLAIAAAFPGASPHAMQRSLLVVLGGLAQWLVLEIIDRFATTRADLAAWQAAEADLKRALRDVRASLEWQAPHMQFALRLGGALLAASVIAHWSKLHNGYWIPMTTVILLRQDFRSTWQRGVVRIGGTVAGVLLASLVEFWLRPGPPALAALAVGFAFLAIAFQPVLYGIFVGWLSAYIVFLLVFGGLIAPVVVENRIASTAIGAALAVAAHVHFHLGQLRQAQAET